MFEEGGIGGDVDIVGPVLRARPNLVRALVFDRIANGRCFAGAIVWLCFNVGDNQIGRNRGNQQIGKFFVVVLYRFPHIAEPGFDVDKTPLGSRRYRKSD